jgi:hypothetical protein
MNSGAEKNRRLEPEDHTAAADRRWRVLFIGDHGKVIAFKRIKTLIGLTLGVVGTALAAVAVLAVANAGLHRRMHGLQEQMSTSQIQIQALRQERDLLTAHVVLVEAKMKEALAGVGRPAPGPKTDPGTGAGKTIDPYASLQPAIPAEKSTVSSAPVEGKRLPLGVDEGIAVQDFYAGWDPARRGLHLRYKLAVTRPSRKPLSGHVIVVFKGRDPDPERWLAMPPVDLTKGKPTGRQKGYTFSINHSKAFSHMMPTPPPSSAYTEAVVYVFSNEGQLLTAGGYDVEIKAADG